MENYRKPSFIAKVTLFNNYGTSYPQRRKKSKTFKESYLVNRSKAFKMMYINFNLVNSFERV